MFLLYIDVLFFSLSLPLSLSLKSAKTYPPVRKGRGGEGRGAETSFGLGSAPQKDGDMSKGTATC